MGKSYRDKPAKRRDIQIKKSERGEKIKIAYNRAQEKQSYRRDV